MPQANRLNLKGAFASLAGTTAILCVTGIAILKRDFISISSASMPVVTPVLILSFFAGAFFKRTETSVFIGIMIGVFTPFAIYYFLIAMI